MVLNKSINALHEGDYTLMETAGTSTRKDSSLSTQHHIKSRFIPIGFVAIYLFNSTGLSFRTWIANVGPITLG